MATTKITKEQYEKMQQGKGFDRTGLGIGRLSQHTEPTPTPSARQIERVVRKTRQAQTCCRCGQSDTWDGAMFTTDPSSGICDDCYG